MENIGVVTGHIYFGVHSFVTGPFVYITMLRDPIERVISHYYYVRREPSHYLYPLAQEMSLSQYVISCGQAEPNNDQTRLLAGKDCATNEGYCLPEMLPEAKKNLYKYFSVVGITEEFDRSLILMKRALNWRTPIYVKKNVSQRRPRKEDLSIDTMMVIKAYNQLDCELYEYARGILEEQVRLQGGTFEQELRIFKKLNGFYSKLLTFFHPQLVNRT